MAETKKNPKQWPPPKKKEERKKNPLKTKKYTKKTVKRIFFKV